MNEETVVVATTEENGVVYELHVPKYAPADVPQGGVRIQPFVVAKRAS